LDSLGEGERKGGESFNFTTLEIYEFLSSIVAIPIALLYYGEFLVKEYSSSVFL
jgi:hypothetical protein